MGSSCEGRGPLLAHLGGVRHVEQADLGGVQLRPRLEGGQPVREEMEEGGYGMRATFLAPRPARAPRPTSGTFYTPFRWRPQCPLLCLPLRSPLAHLEHVGCGVRPGIQHEGGAGEQVAACMHCGRDEEGRAGRGGAERWGRVEAANQRVENSNFYIGCH